MEKAKIGFLYEPGKEQEVCLLFAYLIPNVSEELERLGLGSGDVRVDEWREDPADCLFKFGDRELNIEFELVSRNFFRGHHDPEKCDLIVCWKHTDTNNVLSCPTKDGRTINVKVLDLSKFVKEKCPEAIENWRTKYLRRKVWTVNELKEEMKKNLPPEDHRILDGFVEELRAMKPRLELIPGTGTKEPAINIYFPKLDCTPLSLTTKGRCYMMYLKSTNVANLSDAKIKEIRDFLGESKRKKPRPWHYIAASNTGELVDKMRAIIKIILRDDATLSSPETNSPTSP